MTTAIVPQATYTALTFNGAEAIKFDATGITEGYGDLSVTPAKLTQKLTSGTSVASTSGTSIDFTGIPSWAKRITVMFDGVSTSGTSNPLIQIGDSGGFEITGYISSSSAGASGVATTGHTTGFGIRQAVATDIAYGSISIISLGSNKWIASGVLSQNGSGFIAVAGNKTLSDVLTQVRITTVNGTDTFDAGSINILYE